LSHCLFGNRRKSGVIPRQSLKNRVNNLAQEVVIYSLRVGEMQANDPS
jgi:hypothetical protein